MGARRTRGLQAGPRSQRILASVREAALAELEAVGFGEMSMARVAEAAGVSRATLYRRWPNKKALLEFLVQPQLERIDAVVPQGGLVDGLATVMLQLGENLTAPGGAVVARVLMSAHPEVQQLAVLGQTRLREAFARCFADATEELADGADAALLEHLAFWGAVHWVLERDEPPDLESCRRVMAAAVASGLATAR